METMLIDDLIAALALRSVCPIGSASTSRRPQSGPKRSRSVNPASGHQALARPNDRSPPRAPSVADRCPPTIVAVFVDLAWRQLRATAPGEQLQ